MIDLLPSASTAGPWTAIAVGAVVTYACRAVGVAVAGRMSADSAVIQWVEAVAYALLAALIARMILVPQGVLGDVSFGIRAVATLTGIGAYYACGRSLLAGTGVGAGLLWAALSVGGA